MAADELELPEGLRLPLDDERGPARPLAPGQADAMIAAALAAVPPVPAPAPAPAPAPPVAAPPVAATTLSGGVIAGFVVGAIVATGVCLATFAAMRPEPTATPLPPAPVLAPPTPVEPAAQPAAIEAPVHDEATDEAPSAAPEPAAGPAAGPAPRARPSEQAASDLLEQANTLRGHGELPAAAALYARVTHEHPGTFAAYVAEVSWSAMRLEQLGDPRGAERGFAHALRARRDGPLDLEARDGLARARRALGDTAGERRALEELVQSHPGTGLATRAQSRLSELDLAPSPR